MFLTPAANLPLIERSRRASAVVGAGPNGRSHVLRARSEGPLRLLFPRASTDAAWVVTSSLGGGLVDGDVVGLELELQASAVAVLTTQSSTKAYRGLSSQHIRVRVARDASALVVPDPVVPFRGADFTQATHVELESSSSLALVDAVTAGRVAFGERWDAARIDSTLTITIAGALALRDRVLLLDGAAERMGRFHALATVILVGPRFEADAAAALASIESTGALPARASRVIVGSPFMGGAIVRIAATTVELLLEATRELLRPSCARFGEDPWARKW